jgi:hypothetical protein
MVKQSMVGRKILESQLQRLGVLCANDTISNYPAFDADYKVCKYYVCSSLTMVPIYTLHMLGFEQCYWNQFQCELIMEMQ